MKILFSGASGLIGSALSGAASRLNHQIVPLVRKRAVAGSVFWSPAEGVIDTTSLKGIDAVVHLAGESIASGRWTAARKAKILDSRVQGTTLLARTIAALDPRPSVLVSASAIGYYGNRGDEVLSEDSLPGDDFLASVCRQWEAATEPAVRAGIRVVRVRTGIVLAKQGGALPQMALPFKLGVGGKIGSGKQFMSWIDLDDEVEVFLNAITNSAIDGPVNSVAGAVRNEDFTRTLGRVLSRPTLFPLPAFAARLVLGEMADALLLSSARVEPAKLKSSGFRFRHVDLEQTLRRIFKS